jgi:catabolite regulation protein CreA
MLPHAAAFKAGTKSATPTPAAPPPRPLQALARRAAAAAAAALVAFTPAPPAAAERVGGFAASGLVFKDAVELTAVPDADVAGVTVYVADFKRSLADKLASDFFSEPGQASVTCAVTGPVAVPGGKSALAARGEGVEVFSERRGLSLVSNKVLRVRRLYDEPRRTLVYVAYATRLAPGGEGGGEGGGARYRTSVCAVPLPAFVPGLDAGDKGGGEAVAAPTVDAAVQ